MKILTLHTAMLEDEKTSAVDLWRIYRPWRELKKHVDWQIDESPTAIKEVEKYKDSKDFTNEELEKSGEWLGQYDIVHSSYFTNPAQFALLMTVQKMHGTKFVMDVDDDMFTINPDNPFWLKCDDADVFNMQQMIRNVDYITTTTERLAHELRKRRNQPPETVYVLPNYISDDYKEGSTEPDLDNIGQITIGYFGGASHYRDLNETGCIEAIERLMHKYKNVHFTSVGMIVDKYVPRARYKYVNGQRGQAWATELFPTLRFDIAIAPLEDTLFARSKSNIKWQESTRMGAAVVASDVGPYKTLVHGQNAILTKNSVEAWEEALESLINNYTQRKQLVANARKELKQNWRQEDHWNVLKTIIEDVKERKPYENYQTSQK